MKLGTTESYPNSKIHNDSNYNKLFADYAYYYDNFPEMTSFDHSTNSQFFGTCDDAHPDLMCHVDFYNRLKKQLPYLNTPNIEKYLEMQTTISKEISGLRAVKLHEKIKEIANWRITPDPIELKS